MKIRDDLRAAANPDDALFLQRYFKTGPGEYGEGDVFIGIRVPVIRKIAAAHKDLPLDDTLDLLRSPIHEDRMVALMILVRQMRSKDNDVRRAIYEAYLANTRYINNWDLVDTSAEYIVGAWLQERSRAPLRRLARSKSLWERRIAVLSTFHFIKLGEYDEALRIAGMLLGDREDLIHKATGWMLREIGNRDGDVEREFLRIHYRSMPRTMLRYAIEKFPEAERKRWMAKD